MTEFDDFWRNGFRSDIGRHRRRPDFCARVLTPSRPGVIPACSAHGIRLAAAAAAAIVALHSWASSTYTAVVTEVEQPKLAAQAAALDDITRILGDDEQARADAERLMNVQHDPHPDDDAGQTVRGGTR